MSTLYTCEYGYVNASYEQALSGFRMTADTINGAANPLYDELSDKSLEHYCRFEMVKGVTQDFTGSTNEIMADLPSLCCVFDNVGDNPEVQRECLETFGRFLWLVGTRQGYLDTYGHDNHLSEPVRVNTALSCLDCFYENYEVNEGDSMYTAAEDRLELW